MIVKSSTEMADVSAADSVPGKRPTDAETRYFNFTGHAIRILEGTGHILAIPPLQVIKPAQDLGYEGCLVVVKSYPKATFQSDFENFDSEFVETKTSRRYQGQRTFDIDGCWVTTTVIPYARIEEASPATYYNQMHNISVGSAEAGTRRFEHPMLMNIDNQIEYRSSGIAVAVEVFLPGEKEQKFFVNLNGTIIPLVSKRSNAQAVNEVKISHWSNVKGKFEHAWYTLEELRRHGGISGIRLYETKAEAVSDRDHPRYKDMERLNASLKEMESFYEKKFVELEDKWSDEVNAALGERSVYIMSQMRKTYLKIAEHYEAACKKAEARTLEIRKEYEAEVSRLKFEVLKTKEANYDIRNKAVKSNTANVGLLTKAAMTVVDFFRWGFSFMF